VPFDEHLRARITSALPPAAAGALEISALHAAIGEAFGDALATVASGVALNAVASHGITLAHDGDAHHSLQLGDAFRIRERAGVTVVYDFRSADTAAGGQGAPLVPFVDALLFGDLGPCVAVNLGGIANRRCSPKRRVRCGAREISDRTATCSFARAVLRAATGMDCWRGQETVDETAGDAARRSLLPAPTSEVDRTRALRPCVIAGSATRSTRSRSPTRSQH